MDSRRDREGVKLSGIITMIILAFSVTSMVYGQTTPSTFPSTGSNPTLSIVTNKPSFTTRDEVTVKATVSPPSKTMIELKVVGPDLRTYLRLMSSTNDQGYLEVKFSPLNYPTGAWSIIGRRDDQPSISSKSEFLVDFIGSAPPTLSCDIPLDNITIPFSLLTEEGKVLDSTSAIQQLSDRGIGTTGQVLKNVRSSSELLSTAKETHLLSNSVAKLTLWAELYCVMTAVPLPRVGSASTIEDQNSELEKMLYLLHAAGYDSVFQLSLVDLDDPYSVESLAEYLDTVAITQGPGFRMFQSKEHSLLGPVDQRPPVSLEDLLVPLIKAAKSVTPLLRTQLEGEENIIFSDGSVLKFSEEDGQSYLKQKECGPISLEELEAGYQIDIERETMLQLNINLPFFDPDLTVKVNSSLIETENSPDVSVIRSLTLASNNTVYSFGAPLDLTLEPPGGRKEFVYRTDMYVWIREPGRYLVSFPNLVKLSSKDPALQGAEGQVCYYFHDFKPVSGIEGKPVVLGGDTLSKYDDVIYYPYTAVLHRGFYNIQATINKGFYLDISHKSGSTDYVVITPGYRPGIIDEVEGTISEENPRLAYDQSDFIRKSASVRTWKLMFGQFILECSLNCPEGQNDLISFFDDPEGRASSISLEWRIYDLQKTFYVNLIRKMIYSNDADSGHGEMKMHATTHLGPEDSGTDFFIRYPIFGHFSEVNDHGKNTNLPVTYADIPVISIEYPRLESSQEYTTKIGAYEDDNDGNYFVWNLGKVGFTLGMYIFDVGTCIATAGANTVACAKGFCDTLQLVKAANDLSKNKADDNMGSSVSHFEKSDSFGADATSDFASRAHGFAEIKNEWWEYFGEAADFCGTITSWPGLAPSTSAFTKFKNAMGLLANQGSLYLFLQPPDYDKHWFAADFDFKRIVTVPTIEEIEVKIDSIEVFDDRDGDAIDPDTGEIIQNPGDTSTSIFVGLIGDKGSAIPADGYAWEDYYVSGKKYPFSAVGSDWYPKCEDICSYYAGVADGQTLDINSVALHRSFDDDEFVGGVYLSVGMYDYDEHGDDEEVAFMSKFFDFGELSAAVENCENGVLGYEATNDGWCKMTRIHHTEPGYYLELGSEGDVKSVKSGGTGADIKYEISVKSRP